MANLQKTSTEVTFNQPPIATELSWTSNPPFYVLQHPINGAFTVDASSGTLEKQFEYQFQKLEHVVFNGESQVGQFDTGAPITVERIIFSRNLSYVNDSSITFTVTSSGKIRSSKACYAAVVVKHYIAKTTYLYKPESRPAGISGFFSGYITILGTLFAYNVPRRQFAFVHADPVDFEQPPSRFKELYRVVSYVMLIDAGPGLPTAYERPNDTQFNTIKDEQENILVTERVHEIGVIDSFSSIGWVGRQSYTVFEEALWPTASYPNLTGGKHFIYEFKIQDASAFADNEFEDAYLAVDLTEVRGNVKSRYGSMKGL